MVVVIGNAVMPLLDLLLKFLGEYVIYDIVKYGGVLKSY